MFQQLATEQFGYLMSEFGFSVAATSADLVEFHKQGCRVRVLLDRCQVFLDIGPNGTARPIDRWFDLTDVIHFIAPSVQFEYEYDPEAFARDPSDSQKRQLSRLATYLRRHCERMLNGDFSDRKALEEYVRTRQSADRESMS
jgi:hypothetical protein